MTLAIMQPYLCPYIGYWQLINAVDTFIVYDNIQFSKKGWFHRNNILVNGQKTLFSIPIKKDSDYLDVKDRFLSETSYQQIDKMFRQIQSSYRKAPYFDEVYPLIQKIFLFEGKNLFDYIYHSIVEVCKFLEIDTKIIISSTINIDHTLKSQDKVIALNKAVGANRYINPIGGVELYDKNVFSSENIELLFLKSDLPEYKQFNYDFIPYLSIIDILMFNSKSEIKEMLNQYTLTGND
ncbi:WbqC family protein [Sulfurovum mangrovi]|uniref:WbqC family protein n=1 Tax=Sulfurovum mangrovi TaxID=2893889 RepID=UPI001E5472CA|nr:WbqC family protein [Sulfurovum mangrovi]UFH59361.1 WbqC family protein [Sulfurovum mangrovi]